MRHIDADAVGRQLIEPGAAGHDLLRANLASCFFLADGRVDRRLLRRHLFADKSLQRLLEELLHPLIRREIAARTANSAAICLVEVPLLFEAGWQDDFHRVLVVWACEAQRCHRLMSRDGLDEAAARQALCSQQPLAAKALAADHVIDNGGPWPVTCLQLLHIGDLLFGAGPARASA